MRILCESEGCRESPGADFDDFAGADDGDCSKDFRDEGANESQARSSSADDDGCDADCSEILLMLQAVIGRHDHLKTGINRSAQQDAISQAAPTLLTHRRDFVP